MGSFANRLNPFRYVKTHKPLTIKQMRKVLKTRVFAAGIFFLQDRGTLVKLTMNIYATAKGKMYKYT